jgi:hypothetical protein
VKPLSPRKCLRISRHRRWFLPGRPTEGPGRLASMLARADPDQGQPSLLLIRWVKRAEALGASASVPACPFGHLMYWLGQRGRWPVRDTSPPGGGGGVKAKGFGASGVRPADNAVIGVPHGHANSGVEVLVAIVEMLDTMRFWTRRKRWPMALAISEGNRARAFTSSRVRSVSFAPWAAHSDASRRTPIAPIGLPRTHTRRRAARCFALATFHAGPEATSSVRRDTQALTRWRQGPRAV